MATYTYTGGKFVPTSGGTVIDPSGGFTSTLVSKDPSNPTIIMPVGDSICLGQGGGAHGGWRMLLAEKLKSAGFYFNFVGWNHGYLYDTTTSFPMENSGYSAYGGWKIQDHLDQNASRAGRAPGSPLGTDGIAQWIATYNPSVIIMMLGTNNWQDSSAVRQQAMSEFATAVFTAKPSIKIVWGTVLWQQNNQTSYSFNTEWQSEWAKWTGKTIVKAETQSAVGIVTKNFADTLHPSTFGYERMASAYFQALVNN